MPALREKDFDEMAGRVVDRFVRDGTKLADGTFDEAMGGQLNPDQIERLVQAANTMAFLRLMDARKAEGAPDLTHEFDPVDTRSVLQRILSAGPVHDQEPSGGASTGTDDEGPLPDEMAVHGRLPSQAQPDDPMPPIEDQDGPFPKGKEQDAKKSPEKDDKPKKEPAKPAAKDTAKAAEYRRRQLAKLATVFDDQYMEAEFAFDDGYQRLNHAFKIAHGAPAFDVFEKDALSICDDEHGVIVLNLLRESRGLARIEPRTAGEKHAALVDRHVADDYPALREFERLVKIAKQAVRVQTGAKYVRSLCS